MKQSNMQFEDSRSKREREAYTKKQKLKQQVRHDKYQYERYKARLGDDAPKSFSAFRRLKKAGGEQWGVLEAQYKGMGYYDKTIKMNSELQILLLIPQNK